MKDISIFYTKFTQPLSDQIREQYRQQITFDPRFAANQYRRWQDTQAHLMGRLLLRRALLTSGIPVSALPILQYSEYNRPYFAEGPHFSIAHSGAYVLCAVSDQQPVGVDIERIRPIDLATMQPSFAPPVWRKIATAADPPWQLFDYWTRQEAVAKADGRGLLIVEQIVWQESRARIEDTVWHLYRLPVAPGYIAYLASSGPGSEFKMIPIDY